jgi:hypothetical protein
MELIIVLSLMLAVTLAALFWGTDSREGLDNPEWARRKEWYGKVAR